MKNELVHQIGSESYADSVTIAKKLDVAHKDLLRTIDKVVNRQKKQCADQRVVFPQIFKESSFTNKMGRRYNMYEMNESAFIKLIMQLSGYEKAEIVQDMFIEAFQLIKQSSLNKQNASWLSARKEGKVVRALETDSIKDFVTYATNQGSNNAKFYYSNITKMTNKALELLIQVKDGKPLRDLATIQELGFISVVENRAIQALQYGMSENLPYKYIYKEAKEQVNNLVDSLLFKPLK